MFENGSEVFCIILSVIEKLTFVIKINYVSMSNENNSTSGYHRKS